MSNTIHHRRSSGTADRTGETRSSVLWLRCSMASLFVFGSVNFAATDVAANEAATELGSSHEVQVAADGSRLVRTSTLGDGLEEFPNSGGAGRGDLFRGSTDYLWLDTNHNSAISEDVAISGDGAHGISGWWLNNMRTAFYEMDGDNVPEWTRPMPGIEFQIRVDAADSDRFTSTARNDSLYLFEAAGNTPVASQWYGTGMVGYFGGVSDDGGTYASAGGVSGGAGEVRVFDGTSHALRFSNDLAGTPQGLAVSADGLVAAVTMRPAVEIYDAVTGARRDSIPIFGETQVGSALSGDGRYLVTGGFSRIVRVYEWDGSSYVQIWADSISGTTWISSLAISEDGTTVAAGTWTNPDGGIVLLYDISSATPLWIDTSYADWISDLDFTPDGGILVASSWGAFGATQGNVVSIYERSSSIPIHAIGDDAIVDVGSCQSVAISDDGRKVIAGGKVIHARDFGSGGWTMGIDLLNPASAEDSPFTSRVALRAHPNPFTEGTRIEAAHSVSSSRLAILAADGSLIRRLESAEGDRWNWDGRDEHGRQSPAGVYFVHPSSDLRVEPIRIVRLR